MESHLARWTRPEHLGWLAGLLLAGCGGGSAPASTCTPTGPEVCDGVDNDCNGQVDDGDPGGGAACDTGLLGVCAAGTVHCTGGSLKCVQNVAKSAEVCNGLDDDCDGVVDNGDPGGGAACDTGLLGVCKAGTQHCVAGAVSCVQKTQASVEMCGDGLDNDCDGIVDNPGACCTAAAIGDPGFEAGSPWPAWQQFSTQYGSPLCDAVTGCGSGGSPDATHGGNGWLWLGGAVGAETAWVRQSVVIPAGSATAHFWLQIPSCAAGAADLFQYRIDGVPLFSATNADPACFAGTYVRQAMDASAFADGLTHVLELDGSTNDPGGGAPVTNFFVDDLDVIACPPPMPRPP